MILGDDDAIKLDKSDIRFLLQKQLVEYQEIRSRTSRIFNLVVTGVGIALSIGFIQFLGQPELRQAALQLGEGFTKRCAPESVAYGSIIIRGLGQINFILVVSLLILICWIIIEMYLINDESQGLGSLRPYNELDVQIIDGHAHLQYNRGRIDEASAYLDGMQWRMSALSVLAVWVGILLVELYTNQSDLLLLIDIMLLVVGAGLLLFAAWRFYKEGIESLFSFKMHKASPMLVLLSATAWVFIVNLMSSYWPLVNQFFLC